jgi:acyl-CoA thioesterase-2
MTNPAERLVDLLDLEQIEVNIFRGRSPEESLQRVFGGQVAGQALVAAGRTTDGERPVHSLHAYFLRPGRPGVPIVYQVERVRDGRSFTTRRVTAVQQGRTIFNLTASFHKPEEGSFEHQLPPAREVPDPESLPTVSQEIKEHLGTLPETLERMARRQPFDIRYVDRLRRVDARRRAPGRRPSRPHLRAHVRERHDPAGRRPHPGGTPLGPARFRLGFAGSRHVVPPAVPRR